MKNLKQITENLWLETEEESGKILRETNYKVLEPQKAIKHGEEIIYSENGIKRSITEWAEGIKKTVKKFDEQGRLNEVILITDETITRSPYQNDKKHGVEIIHHLKDNTTEKIEWVYGSNKELEAKVDQFKNWKTTEEKGLFDDYYLFITKADTEMDGFEVKFETAFSKQTIDNKEIAKFTEPITVSTRSSELDEWEEKDNISLNIEKSYLLEDLKNEFNERVNSELKQINFDTKDFSEDLEEDADYDTYDFEGKISIENWETIDSDGFNNTYLMSVTKENLETEQEVKFDMFYKENNDTHKVNILTKTEQGGFEEVEVRTFNTKQKLSKPELQKKFLETVDEYIVEINQELLESNENISTSEM